MYVFLLILCILAVFAAVVFFEPVRISFFLDTDRTDVRALARWIPFAALDAQMVDARPFITMRIFGKRIYEGFLKRKERKEGRKSYGSLLKTVALSDTRVNIACGFHEPHTTGLFCAAADFAGTFIGASRLEIEPDFVPENEFLRIRAKTALNIGKTLANMAEAKLKNIKGDI